MGDIRRITFPNPVRPRLREIGYNVFYGQNRESVVLIVWTNRTCPDEPETLPLQDYPRYALIGYRKFSTNQALLVKVLWGMATSFPFGAGIAHKMSFLDLSKTEALPSSVTFSNTLSPS